MELYAHVPDVADREVAASLEAAFAAAPAEAETADDQGDLAVPDIAADSPMRDEQPSSPAPRRGQDGPSGRGR